MNSLLGAAVLPVIALGYFIYEKDVNKEPGNLLGKLFGLGCLTVIPILIFELLMNNYFKTENITNFVVLFINVFLSVAIIEEGFKWLVVRKVGYNNREFDEVYDIIVYAVFVSLGFACVENILYVFGNGFSNAILRALTAIPGHTCFGVIMGYFMSKAKISSIGGNTSSASVNMVLSLLVPALLHTIYDAILFQYSNTLDVMFFLAFIVFDILMVIYCFSLVNRMSKVQQNLNNNVENGTIIQVNGKVQINRENVNNIKFCPVCGKNVEGCNFCSRCGFKVR